MVGLVVRGVPDRHHGVADEFVDRAALGVDRRDGKRQETGEMRLDIGAELFGQLGEARQVGEENGDLGKLAAGLGLDAAVDQRPARHRAA